jgi:hypothetical protein
VFKAIFSFNIRLQLLLLLFLLLSFLSRLVQCPPHGGKRPDSGPDEADDHVVQDLEDGHQTAAHRQAEDTANVGNEPNQGNFLVALYLRTITIS